MFFRVLFRAVALFAILVSAWILNYFVFRSHAASPAAEAKHGLTGSYYVANLGWENDVPPPPRPVYWSQVWVNNNDFKLPRTFTAPAASRVDSQIAFGQGKGFSQKPDGSPVIWWPTGLPVPAIWQGNELAAGGIYVAAVIWKGYIHLPKAGTYYFGTVSNAPSAVYLNQARVALNGNIAGALVADAFSYAKEDVQDFVQNFSYGREEVAFRPHAYDKYVVPVLIDGPRDLPIEVQFQSTERFNPSVRFTQSRENPLGIDLFWVTPDAPRDANGKPIARIVPADALYTEPPGTIEKPTVRSANSTIEADHLYFPTEYVEGAVTLTIRLADKDGNPIAGKRVHVNSLISFGQADSIVQPEKPTDEKGETTAKIRPYKVEHDSTIFATDVTDLVDLAQVAHVTFQQVDWNFFEPFSPYYDSSFSITPNPPVVGRPTLIKTALKNHSKFPAMLTVTFLTADANIGFTKWAEIAQVKNLKLQPGESKEVSTTFTPKEVMGHKCYRVEVEGRYIAMNPSDRKVFAAALLPPMLANPPDQVAKGAQQINTQTVAPQDCPPPNVKYRAEIACDCFADGHDSYKVVESCGPPGYGKQDFHSRCEDWVDSDVYGNAVYRSPQETWAKTDEAGQAYLESLYCPALNCYKQYEKCKAKARRSYDKCHFIETYTFLAHGDCLREWWAADKECAQERDACLKNPTPPIPQPAPTPTPSASNQGSTGSARDEPSAPMAVNYANLVALAWNKSVPDIRERNACLKSVRFLTPSPQGLPTPTQAVPKQEVAGAVEHKRIDWMAIDRAKLTVLTDLASDMSGAVAQERERTLDRLYEQIELIRSEDELSGLSNVPIDSKYNILAAAARQGPIDYLLAMRRSFARFQGAQAEGGREWMARQWTATRKYAALAAQGLLSEAKVDQDAVDNLRTVPFAVPRPHDQWAPNLKSLERGGLSTEHRELLQKSGIGSGEIERFQKALQAALPDQLGLSIIELYTVFAQTRRALAASLENSETTGRERLAQTYLVSNPHERQETVDLPIRPIAIPPDWKLSVRDAEEQPKFKVREVEAGKHYAVTLPAKAQVKLASVVIPVGEIGANTTARWAVEGKIGNELIGGMVHEMNVPYIIADLKLPPVGSKEVEEELPVSAKSWVRIAAEVAAGIVILALIAYLIIFWRKRHSRGGSTGV